MPDHVPGFPENRFAENRSPDPNDRKNSGTQDSDIERERKHDGDMPKKTRRFSRREIEENLPPEPDPDDPVAP